MSNIFLTSDNHFSHVNIIQYSSRPFKDVEEMDQVMIERWNSVVTPEDTVYHLGDVCMGLARKNMKSVVGQLNGTIHLIQGNHDYSVHKLRECFASVQKTLVLEDKYFLIHNPTHTVNYDIPKEIELFIVGHVHDKWKLKWTGDLIDTLSSNDDNPIPSAQLPYINVGVDCWNFYPQKLENIVDYALSHF